MDFIQGFATIAFITFLNASLAPVWHAVYESANAPPPLLLNAFVGATALVGLLAGAPLMKEPQRESDNTNEDALKTDASNAIESEDDVRILGWGKQSWKGGVELGLWKGLGM